MKPVRLFSINVENSIKRFELKTIGYLFLMTIFIIFRRGILTDDSRLNFIILSILIYFSFTESRLSSFYLYFIYFIILFSVYGYIEFLITLIASVLIYFLRKASYKKFDKDLELLIGQVFVGKFANNNMKVSKLDLYFTVIIFGYFISCEFQLIPVKYIEYLSLEYGF